MALRLVLCVSSWLARSFVTGAHVSRQAMVGYGMM